MRTLFPASEGMLARIALPAASGLAAAVAVWVLFVSPLDAGEGGCGSSAPLQGTLVDARTGEPVPYFGLRVRGEDGEIFATDARGRFRGRLERGPGRVELELVDVPGQTSILARARSLERVVALEHAPGAGRGGPRVEIPVGPTYRLALELPAGRGIEGCVAELAAAGEAASRSFVWKAPLRAVGPSSVPQTWVRFGPIPERLLPGPPWSLTVRSADGLATACSEVASISGVHPETVTMVFRETSSLAGTVLREDGAPVPGKVLYLVRAGEATRAGAPRLAAADGRGDYAFVGLEPGDYELMTVLDESRDESRDQRSAPDPDGSFRESFLRLRLLPGVSTRRDVRLGTPPGVGSVCGVVRSESGAYDRPVELTLTGTGVEGVDGDGVRLHARARWEDRGGALEGVFVFEDVPEGSFTLAVSSPAGESWTPGPVEVRAPRLNLDLLRQDVTDSSAPLARAPRWR